MAYFHDDAVYLELNKFRDFHNRITSGKDLIEATVKSWLSGHLKPISYELEPLAIDIFSDVANVFYRYKYEKGGIPRTYQSNVMVSYIKQHNKWIVMCRMSTMQKEIQE